MLPCAPADVISRHHVSEYAPPPSFLGHYDYHYGYKAYDPKDGAYGHKFGTVTYYYDNLSSNDLYTVDQELLKDYIKRQM